LCNTSLLGFRTTRFSESIVSLTIFTLCGVTCVCGVVCAAWVTRAFPFYKNRKENNKGRIDIMFQQCPVVLTGSVSTPPPVGSVGTPPCRWSFVFGGA
jgi:hypothetical protein